MPQAETARARIQGKKRHMKSVSHLRTQLASMAPEFSSANFRGIGGSTLLFWRGALMLWICLTGRNDPSAPLRGARSRVMEVGPNRPTSPSPTPRICYNACARWIPTNRNATASARSSKGSSLPRGHRSRRRREILRRCCASADFIRRSRTRRSRPVHPPPACRRRRRPSAPSSSRVACSSPGIVAPRRAMWWFTIARIKCWRSTRTRSWRSRGCR